MTQRTEHTVIISTQTYRKLCELATQYGWTTGGREGTTMRAVEMIEEALNVRVEELDHMTSENTQQQARITELENALLKSKNLLLEISGGIVNEGQVGLEIVANQAGIMAESIRVMLEGESK